MKKSPLSPDQPMSTHGAYTFEELRELWYLSVIQGATLWQYCQDTNKKLPVDFEKGLDLLRGQAVDVNSIKFLLSNRFVLLGLFDELLQKAKKDVKQ